MSWSLLTTSARGRRAGFMDSSKSRLRASLLVVHMGPEHFRLVLALVLLFWFYVCLGLDKNYVRLVWVCH